MARSADKTELFERTPVPKAIMILAVPTIISSLVTMVYSLVDTLFVGMINEAVQSAAVTLAYPMLISLNAINNLFGVGASSMMSRALGAYDRETAKRSSAFGFYCSIFFGILYSCAFWCFTSFFLNLLGAEADTSEATRQYLTWTIGFGATPGILNVVMAYMVRSEGASLHASIGTMSGCILNIILDPIFILPWGLDMGAAGAGCATFVSNCVACVYFFILMFVKRKTTVVCFNPKKFTFKKEIVKGVFGVGIPASIQNILNVTSMTVLNNFAANYGSAAVAAMGISQRISHVPMYINFGMSQGIQPLIGYNYSNGNVKRLKQAFNYAHRISLVLMLVISVCCWVFAGNLIKIFMTDAEVVEHGTKLLKAFSFFAFFFVTDQLGIGVYQACGLGGYALTFAVVRKAVLEIPLLIIMDAVYPLYGLPYAQVITEIILTVAAGIVLFRLFRKFDREGTPIKTKPKKKRGSPKAQ